MKRGIVVTILILVCFLLQSTVFQVFSFGEIVPNLLIILTSSLGLMRGEKTGIIIGFVCGLLSDIFFGNIIGFFALILMYIGYVNGKFCRIFYPEDIKLPIALIIVSDLAHGLICYILLFLMRSRFDFGYYLFNVILPEVVYTAVITMILYPIVLKLNNWLETGEKKNAQKFI